MLAKYSEKSFNKKMHAQLRYNANKVYFWFPLQQLTLSKYFALADSCLFAILH